MTAAVSGDDTTALSEAVPVSDNTSQDADAITPPDFAVNLVPLASRRGSAANGSSVDCVYPGLYVSDIHGAKNFGELKRLGITHIVSVINIDCVFPPEYKTLRVSVEDNVFQNVLQYVDEVNEFITTALAGGGRVLVHCFAGMSRSITMVAAYLMKQTGKPADVVLREINSVRRGVQPNMGFLRQLDVYEECGHVLSLEKEPYRRWLLSKYGTYATLNIQAPSDVAYIEAKHATAGQNEIRCKKCRFVLAVSSHVIFHEPKKKDSNSYNSGTGKNPTYSATCQHYFLEPIRWMKPELDQGLLEGRFDCPKCDSKIGSYRWQGMQCSCLEWIVPSLSVMRSKVDEVMRR